jgi:Ser/Thr protein kinase RdoA (MazF antagonist)
VTGIEEIIRAGLASVARLARRLGLPADDLRVLSARGNLVVHVAPAPVVARAATLTARTRRDPAAWLGREVAVARYTAARGGPVAPPTALVDPGPHDVDGLAVSLWDFRPGTERRPSGEELGTALAVLHDATGGFPGTLPWLAPAVDQVDDALRAATLPAGVLAALRARHERVLADLDGAGSAPVVLHGDAHAGNLLHGPGGWFWVDLEETCLGPPEWDLAVLGDPVAVAAYGRAHTPLAPFAAARELEGVVWLQVMAQYHPARYRAPADERLAALLGR